MNAPQRTFSLGDFTFDAGEKSLWRDGVAVPVPPKSGELLAYFVAHAGRLLTKEELLEQVWAGAFVEESNLTHHIAVLRKALGEGETKYIATVPRKGYRFVAPVSLAEELQITLTEKTVTRAVLEETVETDTPAPSRSRRRWAVPLLALVVLPAVCGLAYVGYTRRYATQARNLFRNTVTEKLELSGNVSSAVISPDGKFLAYVAGDLLGANGRLLLRQLATGSEKEIIAFKGGQFFLDSFSPDGEYFYFYHAETGEALFKLKRVAVLGGEIKETPFERGLAVAFSPDGKKAAYAKSSEKYDRNELFVSDADGQRPQAIHTSQTQYFINPRFSPDGTKLLISYGDVADGFGKRVRLGWLPASGGPLTPLSDASWEFSSLVLSRHEWLPDGSGVVVGNRSLAEDTPQVYLIGFPGGEIRRLTGDPNVYFSLSATADRRTLAVGRYVTASSLWEFDLATKQSRQIAPSANVSKGGAGLAVTPGNKLLYVKLDGKGNRDLWQINTDGAEEKLLIGNLGKIESPRISPDGRHVYFTTNGWFGKSRANPVNAVWRADLDGSNLKQITFPQGVSHDFQGLSPDGQSLYFREWAADYFAASVKKLDLAGGQVTQIAGAQGLQIGDTEPSPDGKKMFYSFIREEQNNQVFVLQITDFDGHKMGGIRLTLPAEAATWFPFFAPDGKSLYYFDSASPTELRQFDFATRQSRQITDFKHDSIRNFTLSRDGKKIYLVRSNENKDMALIKDAG